MPHISHAATATQLGNDQKVRSWPLRGALACCPSVDRWPRYAAAQLGRRHACPSAAQVSTLHRLPLDDSYRAEAVVDFLGGMSWQMLAIVASDDETGSIGTRDFVNALHGTHSLPRLRARAALSAGAAFERLGPPGFGRTCSDARVRPRRPRAGGNQVEDQAQAHRGDRERRDRCATKAFPPGMLFFMCEHAMHASCDAAPAPRTITAPPCQTRTSRATWTISRRARRAWCSCPAA